MSDLTRPIAYLEDSDFDNRGYLINPEIPKNVPVVIMAQASWCPHCVHAKPAFQEFANKYKGKVFCATIQSDGVRESEKALGKRISSIKKNFQGFPDFMLFKNGKLVNKEVEGRSVRDLEKFVGKF